MKFFSCFSGIEAASVAFDPLGFECVGFSEIDPFCCELLKTRFPTVRNYGDIEQYKQWDIEPGATRLLCGGSPCQSYSLAGNREGLEDPRGNLALVYFGFLERLRPRWLLLENVPGILSSNGGRDFGTLLGKLARLGYGFAYAILDAQNFSVPQRRKRVFLVGHSRGDWRRPASVLFNRESVFGSLEAGEIQGEGTSAETSGSTRKRDVVGALTASPKNHAGSYTGQDAYQNKLIPVRTPNHSVALGSSVRRLTPRECERLQGFPDDWTKIAYRGRTADKCADAPRYHALGNSWAVPVVRWIGERIKEVDAWT